MKRQDNNDDSFRSITYPEVNEGYIISNNGIVLDSKGNVIDPYVDNRFLAVKLPVKNASNKESFRVHRLVAWEFCPENRDIRRGVKHLDKNPRNNFYQNLEWMTFSNSGKRSGLEDVMNHIRNLNKYSNGGFWNNEPDRFIQTIQRKHPEVQVTKKMVIEALQG